MKNFNPIDLLEEQLIGKEVLVYVYENVGYKPSRSFYQHSEAWEDACVRLPDQWHTITAIVIEEGEEHYERDNWSLEFEGGRLSFYLGSDITIR